MPHVIREDQHSRYIRYNGFVFRPLFPTDYPQHKNETRFPVGTQVTCERVGDSPLVVISGKFGPRIRSETWFSHGSYLREMRGRFPAEHDCYQPEGFSWPVTPKMPKLKATA